MSLQQDELMAEVLDLEERCAMAEGKAKKLQDLVWEYELERAELICVAHAARELGSVSIALNEAFARLDAHYLENLKNGI